MRDYTLRQHVYAMYCNLYGCYDNNFPRKNCNIFFLLLLKIQIVGTFSQF